MKKLFISQPMRGKTDHMQQKQADSTACFFIALDMAFKLFIPDRVRIYHTIAMPE